MRAETLAIILGMASVTYLTRAGAFLVLRGRASSGRLERWLRHLPGAVLISIVAPLTVAAGAADAIATALTGIIALRTRNMPITMAIGVLSALVLRSLI